MNLSANSFLQWKYGYEGMYRIYGQAGFECTDYGLDQLVNDNDVLSGPDFRAEAEKIRSCAEANGLQINQVHVPFTWRGSMWNDEKTFEEIIFPRHIRALEIAGIFGAKVAVVHPLHHFTYPGHEEEIFERNMVFYRRLIPYAKEFGVKIGVENMYQVDPRRKHIIADTCAKIPEFIRYIDTLDSEQITACLDIGHTTLVEQLDEPWDFIRALGHDRLGALHVHDTDYRGDLHTHPYNGIINWGEVTRALGEIDYVGDFTYEVGAPWAKWMDDETVLLQTKFLADLGHRLTAQIDTARPQKA